MIQSQTISLFCYTPQSWSFWCIVVSFILDDLMRVFIKVQEKNTFHRRRDSIDLVLYVNNESCVLMRKAIVIIRC